MCVSTHIHDQTKIDKPSLSALKINVRLFVTTSNFSSPTLVTVVTKAIEMIPLEYTSYNRPHTHKQIQHSTYTQHTVREQERQSWCIIRANSHRKCFFEASITWMSHRKHVCVKHIIKEHAPLLCILVFLVKRYTHRQFYVFIIGILPLPATEGGQRKSKYIHK